MAKKRRGSINTAPPSFRRPWALVFAALALVTYGGMVISSAGAPASMSAAYVPSTLDHRGWASWYGPGFHGSPTASGETFDMYGFTAAHPTLPLGSYARVTNLDNGRSVVVKINDRGPYTDLRMIDLSYAAAREIGMVGKGTARVEVVPLGE
jgi:rare lipoprotein A (peptidoglycan hydrolase)